MELNAASAYWNQREVLAASRERLEVLIRTIDSPTDLFPAQWTQLLALALELRPDLILELGRGYGNSTCMFLEAANRLPHCRIVSLCLSADWQETTLPKLARHVSASWLQPLQAYQGDILSADWDALLGDAARVLILWDAHGFDVAEAVLGGLLPLLEDRVNMVVLHDVADARYLPRQQRAYGGLGLWRGGTSSTRPLFLGHIVARFEEPVALLDFASRNSLEIHSADHSLHMDIGEDQEKVRVMEALLGKAAVPNSDRVGADTRLSTSEVFGEASGRGHRSGGSLGFFSLDAGWAYFSTNDAPRPLQYPRHEASPADAEAFRHSVQSARWSATPAAPHPAARANVAHFDGLDDVLLLGRLTELQFDAGTPFTIEAWVKADQTAQGIVLAYQSNWDDTKASWSIAYGDGSIGAVWIRPATAPGESVSLHISTKTDQRWHHIAVAYDGRGNGSGFRMYYDGLFVGRGDSVDLGGAWTYEELYPDRASVDWGAHVGNRTHAEVPAGEGEGYVAAGVPFAGKITDVRVWSIARWQEEIQQDALTQSPLNDSRLILELLGASLEGDAVARWRDTSSHHHDVIQKHPDMPGFWRSPWRPAVSPGNRLGAIQTAVLPGHLVRIE